MSKRKTSLDKVIEGIEYDIKVLQASLARLVAQRDARPLPTVPQNREMVEGALPTKAGGLP